ncbi:hypothetical protein B0T26DRAFT_614791, partial [Lasiosphaeria miniovina]
LSLTTDDVLVDTGANEYIFVSRDFARKIQRLLHIKSITDPAPRLVGGYDNKSQQIIEELLEVNLVVQHRTIRDEHLIIVDCVHDLMIGRKWLDYHDVLADARRRRLLFPEEWELDPSWWTTVPLDQSEPGPLNPDYQEDAQRRELAIEKEDKRRRDGRLVRARIDELERQEYAGFTVEDPRTPEDPFPEHDAQGLYRMQRDGIGWYKERPIEMAVLNEAAFKLASKGEQVDVMTLHELDKRISELKELRNGSDGLDEDDEKLRERVLSELPSPYHDFLDVFSRVQSDILAPRRGLVDHRIRLLPEKEPEDLDYSPLYKMSLEELEA